MTGGNAHHGRRDNGLFAAAYAAVGDVDPRIGEHLLDVLGNRGIAAYLQPTVDTHPITRMSTLPARPTDRLYVDRSEVDTAREFLEILKRDGDEPGPEPKSAESGPMATASHAPGSRASNEFDDAWASIVAGYSRTADVDDRPWPTIENVAPQAPEPSHAEPSRPTPEPSLLDAFDTFGAELEDEDDTYHPPAPPPLPHFATITIVAVIGILAGLAILADPSLLPLDSTAAALLGCLSILAGAVALIGRLRSGRDDEPDDPTNGAVI